MRIAIVHHLMEPRGGGFHCARLADWLHSHGCEVHLFALASPYEPQVVPRRVPQSIFAAPPREGDEEERFFAAANEFSVQLADSGLRRYDLIHVHDALDAAAVLSLGLPRGAIVRTVHHLPDVPSSRLRKAQEEGVTQPGTLVVVSRFWQEILRERFGRDAWRVTNGIDPIRLRPPAGFDRDRFRKRLGAESRFVFLAVGGLSPRKGSAELFGALAMLKGRTSRRPLLVVVGGDSFNTYDEYRDDVLNRAAALSLHEGADYVLTGAVPDAEIGAWFRSSDALVFSSVNEGWGLAILEAMSVELPVVAFDLPVLREFADDRDVVFATLGDETDLMKGMLRLIEDPPLRERLAKRGPRVAEPYTWDALGSRQMEIYESVLRA